MGSDSAEPAGPPPVPPARPLRPWPVLRALLITGVLLLHASLAAPWPDLRPSDLRYGVAQDELKRWSGILSGIGVQLTPDQLAERVLAVGRGSILIQKTLHGPFKPLLRVTGTGQSWGLFAYPDPYAGRLVIQSRAEGSTEWTTLYRAPRAGQDWLVDLVESRRVRGIYDDAGDRPRAGGIWNRLADYLAVQVMVHDPDAAEVAVRFDQRHMPIPGRHAGTSPEKPLHPRFRTRADVAEALAAAGGQVPPAAPASPPPDAAGPVGGP